MENSRVEKYKEYRTKLISDGDKVFEPSKKVNSDPLQTTSTLPGGAVSHEIEKAELEDKEFLQLEKKRMIIKYSLFGTFLILVTIAIVIFAIYAFGK